MKSIMENLVALQTLQLQAGPGQKERQETMEVLRGLIPPAVLVRYDRLVNQGKKGVAIVRNGVCTGCHISVATGPLAGLAQQGDVRTCGNCGRYLFLAPIDPSLAAPAPVRPPAKTARRKKEALAHAD